MEFMFPLKSIRRATLLVLAVGICVSARDYCSLTVQVATVNGYKPTGVSVTLIEASGRVQIGVTKEGQASFCDLGLSPVSLTIGERDGCNEISIRNIEMNWETERVVNVIYSNEYCGGDEVQAVGCLVLLRFVDEQTRSVPYVQLEPPIGRERSAQSDRYGRTMVQLQPGQRLVVDASVAGYKSERVELRCGLATSKREIIVILHSAK